MRITFAMTLFVWLAGCQLPPNEQIKHQHQDAISAMLHIPNSLSCKGRSIGEGPMCESYDAFLRSEIEPFNAQNLSELFKIRRGSCANRGDQFECTYNGATARSNARFRHLMVFKRVDQERLLELERSHVHQYWIEE